MRSTWLRLALLSLALAACGGGSSSAPAPQEPAPTHADSMCPVEVPGTSVTVEDTDTGAALVFVTTGDVAELRRRVEGMASMHNEHHAAMGELPTGDEPAGGGGHEGHDMGGHDMGGGQPHDMGGGMMVHSRASAEEIDGGARLVLVAAPDDVANLQEMLRMHAQHLQGGTCEMPEQEH